MKVVSLRALARQAPDLHETVLVSHQGTLIGRFVPLGLEEADAPLMSAASGPSGDRFNTRPFTPVPKPGAGR